MKVRYRVYLLVFVSLLTVLFEAGIHPLVCTRSDDVTIREISVFDFHCPCSREHGPLEEHPHRCPLTDDSHSSSLACTDSFCVDLPLDSNWLVRNTPSATPSGILLNPWCSIAVQNPSFSSEAGYSGICMARKFLESCHFRDLPAIQFLS